MSLTQSVVSAAGSSEERILGTGSSAAEERGMRMHCWAVHRWQDVTAFETTGGRKGRGRRDGE